ncbi:PfkB family carbohydrate kinase [Halothermothrix orenii]|uniref:PfkB domain protein n=1 Tax=Halothermothrix orenii (strain H 168 / OCM 544 / DSM 9562) TaxID=373903 RepID=B8CZM4_HALOH|nr:PfkB family carbohydrate kinase [Halothermothrix orenii]ACL70743.1 PfkB domain protein [Halothermothrix orenii H 168]
MPEVITMGEALIDFVPRQVNCALHEVSDFHRAAGGAPANVAVGVARLGVSAGFMGKVGDDAFGYFLKKTLEDNKVNTSQMVLTEEAMTTLAFVSLRGDGERDFAFYRKPGADMLYRVEEVDFDYLEGSHIFHFGSISLITDPSKTTTLKLIKQARSKGVTVSFDPNIRPPLWGSLEEAVKQINQVIPEADILKINEEELKVLTGLNDLKEESILKACQEFYQKGPELIIVTLGGEGCFYYSSAGYGMVEGFKTKAIDTTGAGDSFVAAVLSSLVKADLTNLQGLSTKKLEEILTFANKVASIVVTRNGGIPSLPFIDEVEGGS